MNTLIMIMTIASLVPFFACLPHIKQNVLTNVAIDLDTDISCSDETSYISPDGKWKVYCRNGNLWLSDRLGANTLSLTHDGGKQTRIQYGTVPWVYTDSFGFTSAVWWSPDSKKVAYYRFDERSVLDYYLQLNNLGSVSALDIEPYPLPGSANPLVDIYIYDIVSHKTVRADAREASSNGLMGYYVYPAHIQTTTSPLKRMMWSNDSKRLLFYRKNRRQNAMDFVACDPNTGKSRTIVRETSLHSWVENSPVVFFLPDWKQFILVSERSGWWNLYLYDISGKPVRQLTCHAFDVEYIYSIKDRKITYLAHCENNLYDLCTYQVNLDGSDDHLVNTDESAKIRFLNQTNYDTDAHSENVDNPSFTRLQELNNQTSTRPERNIELFTFIGADKYTTLYGCLEKPLDFDPNKKYPLLVIIYLQPGDSTVYRLYHIHSPYVDSGFLVAAFDSRGSGCRGKDFKHLIYGKFGMIEIDDQAEGVRYLCQRAYVDAHRIGVVGSSQGGYDAIMCLLRHPDVFQVACASSSVTDWRNYYSIYTERYMGFPEENKTGYDEASAIMHACDLKGKLLLFYGTADKNVHPSNTLQLVNALQEAHKSFSIQVGPDRGHEPLASDVERMFLIENLIVHPPCP